MTDKTNTKDTAFTDPYDDKEVLQYMQEEYVGADDTDEARSAVVHLLSDELGKSLASIRGKLVALGVYKPKVVVKKGNNVTKDQLAEHIANIAKEDPYNTIFSDGEIESLAKANKTALRKLIVMLELMEFGGEPEVEDIPKVEDILREWDNTKPAGGYVVVPDVNRDQGEEEGIPLEGNDDLLKLRV